MTAEKSYLFGPVPSRRLGLSLGVDIVPLKTCTQNCIYCQLGIDGVTTMERKEYVSADIVIEQIRKRIKEGLKADYITFSGSGEPTLNSELERMIDAVHKMTDIPLAVITNGTLLYDPDVRRACAKADVVLPSLDAGDEQVFKCINKPYEKLNYETYVQGLSDFSQEYTGQIWLEIFLVEGINTDEKQIEKFKAIIDRINPVKIHLNTAVRPTTDQSISRISEEKMLEIAKKIGRNASVIADYSKETTQKAAYQVQKEQVLELLSRRPCSLDDICSGLEINRNEALKVIYRLQEEKKIISDKRGEKNFFKVRP